MLARIWKKLLMFILIVLCLFNVVTKFVKRTSLRDELLSSARYADSIKENAEKEAKQK